ncbi:MAG: uridine kinase [Defluviitaleaceae bacterium]|nr:uridine kinase [Defluviitaleaceae bacterium]MCL2835921.1 uridine kinase [Defluviitaleaceae bacterium]
MSDIMVIGIAGGTGSGKTTVTKKIKQEFGDDVTVICHDFYYKKNDHLTFEERVKMNYDHPHSLDTDMLVSDIKSLKQGKTVNVPVYSFVTFSREDRALPVKPTKVIIIEGILLFENKELRDLMDIKIFVDADADIRIIRRITRDVKERQRDLDSVIAQYCGTVKPMHEQFVEPSKKYADIIIPHGGHNTVALNMIIEKIRSIKK